MRPTPQPRRCGTFEIFRKMDEQIEAFKKEPNVHAAFHEGDRIHVYLDGELSEEVRHSIESILGLHEIEYHQGQPPPEAV